jgi:hypothetical protein
MVIMNRVDGRLRQVGMVPGAEVVAVAEMWPDARAQLRAAESAGPARGVTFPVERFRLDLVRIGDGARGLADAELLARTADGDRAAFAELYRRHALWLLLRLQRRCSDRDLVDEVVQDTFLAVWRGAGYFGGQAEVGVWIWGIARRRLVDAFRRRPRETVTLDDAQDVFTPEVSAEEVALRGWSTAMLVPL